MTDIGHLTLAQLSDLVRSKALSPVEITAACLERIERVDPYLDCFLTLTAERAMNDARRAEAEIAAGQWRGPLHGIPYGAKDVYNTAGIRTTGHSRILMDNVPQSDATVVRRLAEAGAILVGKLATHELTDGGPSLDLPWPPARNPWDPHRITGGSSSGSGAAVAAGLVPAALGSDTGGSIRIPATLCGVAGLKPTAGLVSRHGVVPNSFSLDTCGPMAWTAEDCAILLGVMAGYDPEDLSSIECPPRDFRALLTTDLRGVRVGVVRHWWEEEMQSVDDVCAAMETALDTLKQLGAIVGDVRLRPLPAYYDVRAIISGTELLCVHYDDFAARPDAFSEEFFLRIAAFLFQATDYVHAQRERTLILAEMRSIYERYDVLVTAGTGPAPRFDATLSAVEWLEANDYIYTPFNITAGPVLGVCNGYTASGLPLGMQIAGAPFADEAVLRVGYAYEQATSWRARRPPVPKEKAPPVPGPNTRLPPPQPLSAEARAHVAESARRAGFALTPKQREKLERAAGAALARSQRIPRDQSREVPLASVFRFG